MTTTRCGIITGGRRSAIAVVALRGPAAGDIVSSCFHGASEGRFFPGQIRFGQWCGPGSNDQSGESVVITPLADSHLEIHCHGGTAATRRIMEDLIACGAEAVQPGPSIHEGQNLLVQEATEVLCRCLTPRTAAIAMDQVRGALQVWAAKRLSHLDDDPSVPTNTRQQAEEIVRAAPFTTRLTQPQRVVLLGPPNVGKSSLLNAIIGFNRSITLDLPGTTRDVLHADTVIEGLPIRLSDTAGIRESEEAIEIEGMERARSAATESDLVIYVTQPSLLGSLDDFVDPPTRPIRVLNKSDLLSGDEDLDSINVRTNALTGDGIETLMKLIAQQLADLAPGPGDPAPINERQAGLLREIGQSETADQMKAALHALIG